MYMCCLEAALTSDNWKEIGLTDLTRHFLNGNTCYNSLSAICMRHQLLVLIILPNSAIICNM